VGADEHLAQLDKITMFLIVNLNDTPWIATASNLATLWIGDFVVGTNHREWNFGHNFLILSNGFFVIEFVAGSFKDLNGVVLDIGKNLIMLVKY
jgi:hypothetical protein